MENSRWKFIWNANKNHLMIMFIFVAVLLFFMVFNTTFVRDLSGNYWDIIEPLLTFLLIGISVSIWLNEQRENWRNALPKKLNVTFEVPSEGGDPIVYKIYNAPLAHEGDIRNWGLSIGQTILLNGARADFTGFHITYPTRPVTIDKILYAPQFNVKIQDKKKKYMLYEITFYLNKPIKDIENNALFVFNEDGNFQDSNDDKKNQNNS